MRYAFLPRSTMPPLPELVPSIDVFAYPEATKTDWEGQHFWLMFWCWHGNQGLLCRHMSLAKCWLADFASHSIACCGLAKIVTWLTLQLQVHKLLSSFQQDPGKTQPAILNPQKSVIFSESTSHSSTEGNSLVRVSVQRLCRNCASN